MIHKDEKKRILKSPLRYPGGKGAVYPFFIDLLNLNNLKGARYFEPFAGGAGVGLALLSLGYISEMIINDYDYHVYRFWDSVLRESERFAAAINDVEVTVDEWYKQKDIYNEPNKYSAFEVGFSTFFLNRCNRSGIISGAGPIGGYEQKGKWYIDERFNKAELIERILRVGELKKYIYVSNDEAGAFLVNKIKKVSENVFFYLDPPYFSAGKRLYLNFYREKDHRSLAMRLRGLQSLNSWMLTYDDNSLVWQLYGASFRVKKFYKQYSLQKKVVGEELVVSPYGLVLPNITND